MNKSNLAAAFFIMGFILLLGMSLFLNTILSTSNSITDYLDTVVIEGIQTSTLTDEGVSIDYVWNFKGKKYELFAEYEKNLFEAFIAIPKLEIRSYSFYTNVSAYDIQINDSVVDAIADELLRVAKIQDFSREETANFILSFVQSLGGDVDPDDHVKFPYETLYEGKGDCEDMAILANRLLSRAGYDVAIIQTKNHVGLGILGDFKGTTFTTENSSAYYYAETTGAGFEIGELPKIYEFSNVDVYEVNPLPFTDISWESFIRNESIANVSQYIFNVTLEGHGTPHVTDFRMFLETKDSVNTSLEKKLIFEENFWVNSSISTLVVQAVPSVAHRFKFVVDKKTVTTSWIHPG